MNERKQLITPLMTDEEAQQIARRTVMAVEALGVLAVLLVFIAAWVVVPA